jgi:3-methylfumaryl-CoA hydratase
MQDYRMWIGRQRSRTDMLDRWRSEALAATLGFDAPNSDLPAFWHWAYFLETPGRDAIGPDGHTLKGCFLPPVPNPRRMFGGARMNFYKPMRFNREATVLESVKSVVNKSGGSGEIYIVTVSCDYFQDDELCIEEERDIIYLPAVGRNGRPSRRWSDPDDYIHQGREQAVDRITLFRFSALTFNPHRIHYDERYAMEEEGHEGLVVHGPLLALLLLDHIRRYIGRKEKAFAFRAVCPVYEGCTFRVCTAAETDACLGLAIRRNDGAIAMIARAELRK